MALPKLRLSARNALFSIGGNRSYLCSPPALSFLMRFLAYPAFALLLAASACSSNSAKPENELLSNDFESLTGWSAEHPSLTREKAHSGQYSIKIQKGIDYSLTYRNILGKISPNRIDKLRIKAFVYLTKPTQASLAVQLMQSATDGTSIFNQAIILSSKVKNMNEWTKIDEVVDLPANAAPGNELRIYTWGASNDEVVYLDDLQVLKE